MRLYTALKTYLNAINDNDIRVYTNNHLSRAGYSFSDTHGSLYTRSNSRLIPYIALGIARTTDKRVFIFSTTDDLSVDIGFITQMGSSGLMNIFYVLFDTRIYNECNNMALPFCDIKEIKGLFVNNGVLIHDYTSYFNNKPVLDVSPMVKNINGPLATLISVDKQKCSYDDIPKSRMDIYTLNEFINNVAIGTSQFNPGGLL